MADEQQPVGDEVQWYLDADGTEWFAEDGVRFELAEDGFAYPVVGGSTDPTGSTPMVIEVEPEPNADAAAPPAQADDVAESPFSPRARRDGASQVAEPVVGDAINAEDETEAVEISSVTDRLGEVGTDGAAAVRRGEDALLRVEGLDAGYGSLPVLKGVDLTIQPGETAVLLGLNGAGKTTTAWTVSGALAPWGGQITFDGSAVAGWSTAEAVQAGVVMVPEGRRVFPDLSVGRNLQVGAWMKRADKDHVDHQRERVFDYFPRLREREQQLAGTLSGGEQQMLAIGRGIMADPRMLIIDEASMGLAPVIVKDVFDIIAQINGDGVTVLLIEQNVGALEVADVGYVMEQGRMVRVLEGDELRDRSVVSAALMG